VSDQTTDTAKAKPKAKPKPTKEKKTRLKGTKTHRPCVDCGKMKDRFADFKPRWAGCATHRTERGRRYFEPGCEACKALVNGNIRQPRCIECDKARPKKRNKKAKAPKVETPVVVPEVYGPVQEAPKPVVAEDTPEEIEAILSGEPVAVVEVPSVAELPTVVGLPEVAPESVNVPEPTPEPVKPKRPKIATMADMYALFDSADETDTPSDE
jgi:hypothetical protein